MIFKFKPKVTITTLIFVVIFIRLSYWQWERYQAKLPMLEKLRSNLSLPVTPITSLPLTEAAFWDENLYRRIEVKGNYNFKHEMLLRNRRFEDQPGMFLITPLTIENSELTVLVQRGFIPLADATPDKRVRYQKEGVVTIVGLVKPGRERFTFLQPADPPSGPPNPWVDAWLRVDISSISKQLPYTLLPIYLEALDPNQGPELADQIIRSDETKEDMLVLTERMQTMAQKKGGVTYPVAVVDPVVPAGRHLGYVYEWGILALLASLFGIALQLKRDSRASR